MTTVLFSSRRDGRYRVEFHYSAVVVELLKAMVPAHARSWNAATREWTVNLDWVEPLAAALRACGHTVVGFDETAPAAQCGSWARHLYRAVGPHRLPAVHRALSKVLHPDNTDTGSHELQRELNDARAELEAP